MKIKWPVIFTVLTLFSLTSVISFAQKPDTLRSKDDLAGWIYHRLQYVAAEPLSRTGILTRTQTQAWRRPNTPEEIQAWLDLLTNQGYIWLLNGNIVRSTDSYISAFEWAKEHAGQTDPAQVLDNILKPLGNNYTRLGDFEQALYIHNKALALAKALDDPDALAGTYSNLANTASNMGYTGRSLEYCRLGLAIPKVTPALRGLLLSEQADAYLQTGDQTAAMTSIQKSIPLLEKGNRNWLLLAYQQAGDINAASPSLALKYYNKALAIGQSQTGTREKAKLYYRLCRLYTGIHDTSNANRWFNKCLTTLLPNRSIDKLQPADLIAENTLADLLFTGARIAQLQYDPDEALRRYRLSFATESTLRSEYINGSAKQQSVAAVHDRYEAAIETAYDAWQTTKRKTYQETLLEFIEGSRAQLLMEELTRARQSRSRNDSVSNRIRLLEQAVIYYRKESLEHPVPQLKETEWQLAQLQKKHVPNTTTSTQFPKLPYTTRSWFTGRSTLYTVETDNGQISFVDRQPMPANLRQFTDHWFAEGPGAMLNDPEAWYTEAYKIYQQLIARHRLQRDQPYIFLPDGPLVGLPFDALPTRQEHNPSPASWPFLIKEANISYAYSLQTLAQSLQDTGKGKGFAGFFLTGTGDPNNKDLPQLNAIQQERQGIQKLIPKGEWFEDEKGTTTAFAHSLQQRSIVHISSHAFSGKDTTTLPRIELYNAPYYIFELKDLGQHPDLVVLDACRTGDGRMVAGEGAQSLARAFTAGGVNAVIAGWWNVNDQTASALMQQFYRQLTNDSAAAALHKAKLNWLGNETTSYQQKLPYYWAALNYTGDPSPALNLQAKSTVSWIWRIAIISAAMILLGLLIAARRIILQPSR